MLVERVTWLAKRGCRSQVLEIGQAEVKEMNAPHAVRCYTAAYGGCHDAVIWEFEFESIGEHDEFFAHWRETRGEELNAKMNPLAESLSTEFFELVD